LLPFTHGEVEKKKLLGWISQQKNISKKVSENGHMVFIYVAQKQIQIHPSKT
jgi:hypothetical protein